MYKKIFKNRITQEDATVMDRLQRTKINMNYDKKTTDGTPNGLFFISYQPNNRSIDEVQLESDFKSILGSYYRWNYGSKWTYIKHAQMAFEGVIEKQAGQKWHIHIIIENWSIMRIAIFLGYTKELFKRYHPRASFDAQRIYDINGCHEYISVRSSKDMMPIKRRTGEAIYISSEMFQGADKCLLYTDDSISFDT